MLRLVGASLQEMAHALRQEFSDDDNLWTLRAVAIPDTIALGKIHYKTFREGLPRGKTNSVVHNGLPRVPSTLPPGGSKVGSSGNSLAGSLSTSQSFEGNRTLGSGSTRCVR